MILLDMRHILQPSKGDEDAEIEFELAYLASLTLRQRFQMMETKSRELRALLVKNGYKFTPRIIQRS